MNLAVRVRQRLAHLLSSVTKKSGSNAEAGYECDFSIIWPVRDVPGKIIDDIVASIRRQSYSNWELCICDDVSTSSDTICTLESYRGTDPRIKITSVQYGIGVQNASCMAVEFATGRYLIFTAGNRTFHRGTLKIAMKSVLSNPKANLLCLDHGAYESIRVQKRQWRPTRNVGAPVAAPGLSGLLVIRKSSFLEAGGIDVWDDFNSGRSDGRKG